MSEITVNLASKNRDKVREVKEILSQFGIIALGPEELPIWSQPEENESTLEGNAFIKAKYCASQLGGIALADDTGLFVDALGGEPGVRSARYAGDNVDYNDNNIKLLKALDGIPVDERTAYFETVVVGVKEGESLFTISGVLRGIITTDLRGEGGFGYDPIFYLSELKKTLAELEITEKNEISHRRKAFEKAGLELLELREEGII